MAGLLGNVVRGLPSPIRTDVVPEEALVGEILGGPIIPRGPQPIPLGGRIIDGEVVGGGGVGRPNLGGLPPGGAGVPPTGSVLPPAGGGGNLGRNTLLGAGAGALGLQALTDHSGVTVGGEPIDDPGVVIGEMPQTDAGTELTGHQNALLDAADLLVQDSGKPQGQFEQELRDTVPEKDLPWFDRFAQEFDLLTIGMALLASNDGKRPMVANLGDALMAGRAAAHRKKRTDKEDLAAQAAAERQARMDALKEREVRAAERRVDVAAMKAENDALKAQAEASGISLGTPSGAQINEVADLTSIITGEDNFLKVRGKKANQTDKAWASRVAREIELAEKQANQRGQTLSTDQRQQIVANNMSGLVADTSIFGISTGVKFDRDAAQTAAQQGSQIGGQQQILQRIAELESKR